MPLGCLSFGSWTGVDPEKDFEAFPLGPCRVSGAVSEGGGTGAAAFLAGLWVPVKVLSAGAEWERGGLAEPDHTLHHRR